MNGIGETIWAIEESAFRRLMTMTRADFGLTSGGGHPPYTLTPEGVAVITLDGSLARDSWFGTDPATIKSAVRAAAGDPAAKSILMVVDSPGGSVSGIADLADTFAEAGKVKPTVAYAADIACSAAYMVACQARKLYAGPTAMVGSIGTFLSIADWSKAADMAGIKVNVVKAGEFKGAGVMGTVVTDAQLADAQRLVNSINNEFVARVGRGRGMSGERVQQLADGRVHIGQAAVDLGLADGVRTLEQVIAEMSATAGPASQGAKMATAETTPAASAATPAVQAKAAATIAELKAAFPGRFEFALECVEKGLSLIEAKAAYADVLTVDLAARDRRIGELTAQAKTKPPAAGAQPAPLPGAQAAAGGEPSDEEITSGKVTEAQFAASPDLKSAFMGDFKNYQAYAKAAQGGRVSIKSTPAAKA